MTHVGTWVEEGWIANKTAEVALTTTTTPPIALQADACSGSGRQPMILEVYVESASCRAASMASGGAAESIAEELQVGLSGR